MSSAPPAQHSGERPGGVPGTYDLATAVAAEIGGKSKGLAHAYQDLSDRYRDGRATPGDSQLTKQHVHAYLAARMPATLAVDRAVFDAVLQRRPAWAPKSLIDLGAGPGTATWAAAELFDSLEHVTCVEQATAMVEVGKQLARRSASAAVRGGTWHRTSVTAPPAGQADLVVASFVLGELPDAELDAAVDRWWDMTLGELVIVEPGTPAGFARIRRVRERLIGGGATITAPCPSDAACPMTGDDWCHFSARVTRSGVHRAVKGGELGFEDEKFAYVSASRLEPSHAPARILRAPQIRPGHIRFTVCEAPELREEVVARSQKDAFRWARKAHWGDEVPPGTFREKRGK
ncbi:small ribosomal subunit Rsm22 family protein [Yinghuangia soli]|uniref:Small ribosomal subunit Rsm22 family protein n=1 Tax=Yinghuangia soli TaxID=2908204 RepID=A0AA41U5K7_9ACTN|nr:small ribosomal subunit Rsm22 family protein [Yinghuangia soli]MCF2532037.1 small ribosomal subunit Rsm22 family protein [Yinghuangia soli]